MKNKVMTAGLVLTSLVASEQLVVSPAAAQQNTQASQSSTASADAMGQIVVTAQRRQEFQREVPISITSIKADQLERAGVKDLSGLSKVTPTLRFDGTGAFIQPTLRGIGTSVATPGSGPNVGIYVDGFYSPNPIVSNFQLLNVQSVQVLKGPQGTLFGRNSTGGAIVVTTAKASTTTSGALQAAYGSYNTLTLKGYGTTGLSDKVAMDVEGLYRKSDGWLKNIYTGDDKAGRLKDWSVRTGLKFDVSDNFSFLVRYAHDHIDDNNPVQQAAFESKSGQIFSSANVIPGAIIATKRGEVSNDAPIFFHSNSNSFQLTGTLEFDFATLTSYTQYRRDKSNQIIDIDHSSAPVFAVQIPVDDKTITQEFLLSSKPGGPLQWTTGVYYFDYTDAYTHTSSSSGVARAPASSYFVFAHSSTNPVSIAPFADVTYEITPKLFVTGGLRYSHDEVKNNFFHNEPGPQTDVASLKENNWSPRAVIRFKPSDNSSIYASYTRGHKTGLVNVGGGAVNAALFVAPEHISAYEIGAKYGQSGLSAEVSGFYYDYTNLQVTSYTGTASVVTNAARSRIYGLEAQFSYQIAEDFEISAGAAYLDAKYKSFPTSPIYTQCLNAAGCGPAYGLFLSSNFDSSGHQMLRAPKFSGNVALRYSTDLAGGRLGLSSNLYYSSNLFFDAPNQFFQKAYAILGLRAEWTDPSEKYTIAVTGDNVTNSKYRANGDPGTFGAGANWGAPATVEGSIRYKF